MKKLLVLGITAAFVLAAAAGAAGLAYAQTAPQTDQPDGAYECPMGGPIGGGGADVRQDGWECSWNG
jgi:hypothetical protein